MDENPYKAPVEFSGDNAKKPRAHPILDPFWNRVQWAVLMLPFLIWLVIALVFSIVG